MRCRTAAASALWAALSAFAWAAASPQPGEAGAGAVSGRVFDSAGRPVPGARVWWSAFRPEAQARLDAARGLATKPLGETKSDAEGRFTAAIAAAFGPVALQIEAAGLPWASLPGPFVPGESVEVSDIEIPAPSALSGVVTGADGKPVAGARVRVASLSPAGDADVFAEALTDSRGAFRIANAPASARRLTVRTSEGGWVAFERLFLPSTGPLRVALERGGAIAGTVLDPAGKPAAGALVRAGYAAAAADAQGRYRLDGVAQGPGSVEAVDGGSLNLVARRGVTVRAGGEAAADLRLSRGAEIAGTVLDAVTRRPLAGARVIVADAPGSGVSALGPRAIIRSDSRGRYSAAGLPPGNYALRAEKQRYIAASLPRVSPSAAAPASPTLALVPEATIAGRVVDPKGKPVAGARVVLQASRGARGRFAGGRGGPFAGFPRSASTFSRPDGSFLLEGLSAVSSGVSLTASHEGFASAERPGVTLKTGQALKGIVLSLPPGLTAKGRVVDEESQPVANAEIRVERDERPNRGGRRGFRPPDASTPPRALSGDDGSFAVSGLSEGEYELTVSHDGFSPKTAPGLRVRAKEQPPWPPIVLARGAALAGVVRDSAGTPIPGATLALFGEGISPQQETTDGAGAFRLAGLPKARALMLAASAPGYGSSSRSVTPPAEGLTLVLSKTGSIRGHVRDAATGDPVTAFVVSATPGARGRGRGPGGFGGGPGGGMQGGDSVYSDEGAYEIPVPPGSWTVRVLADGYLPGNVANVDVENADPKDGVDLELKRGGSLTGRVMDTRGMPVSGATISCCDPGGRPAPGLDPSSGPSAVSDGDGRFGLSGLPEGRATLTATHPDYQTASRDTDPSATGDVVITMSTGGEISGVVVSSDDGSPVPGAAVLLAPQGDSGTAFGAQQSAQADGAGTFFFDHLPSGRYRLSAQSKTASSAPQDLVLADGQAMGGVRVAVETGVAIDGLVSGLSATRLPGVTIDATATGFHASATTGDGGHFTMQSVPAGIVRFSASTPMPNARTAAQTIEISGDDPQESVEIAFQGGSRLAGQVTRAGKPLPQFNVMATPDPPDGTGQRYTAMSDGSGRYAIEDMNDGNYQVAVLSPDGSGSYRTTLAVSGDTNGDIALPGATVSGIVYDAAAGSPLEGASVQAETGSESGAQAIKHAVTDSTGAYSLSDLDPGQYQVSARDDGYQLKTQSATVGSDAVSLNFALDPGNGLTIQALDGLTSLPLGGVTALVFGAGGGVAFQGSVPLDTSGIGEIPSLPPGQYTVYVFSNGYAPHALPFVTVPSDTVPVALTPGGRVEVHATVAANGSIEDASGNPVLLTPFRLDGAVAIAPPVAVIQHVAPGSYAFVMPGADKPATYPFTVTEGQTTSLQLP